jgi:hypothetical protein
MYNPVRYVDPSGHGNGDPWCADNPSLPGCKWAEEDGEGDVGGLEGEQQGVPYSDSSVFVHSMNLSKSSEFVPYYYSDYPGDPSVGSDPIVLIDFLLRFTSLLQPSEYADDTFFYVNYTNEGSQFTINEINVISSFEGPGRAFLAGIVFQSGDDPEIIYDLDYTEITPSPMPLDTDPISFTNEKDLIIDLVIVCRGCYDVGQGTFTMFPTQKMIIDMGYGAGSVLYYP